MKISTDVSEAEFEKKAYEALEALGHLEISDRGVITVSPKTSLVSFLSKVKIAGKITRTDDGFRVAIQYGLDPSETCWVAAVLLFLFLCMIGGGVIFAPLVLDKPNVARTVEDALRDLKHSFRDIHGGK